MNEENEKFMASLHPDVQAAVRALDDILRRSPDEYTTVDLVQIWASLDYAHALMRTEVYKRPDVGKALLAAIEALNDRGLVRH